MPSAAVALENRSSTVTVGTVRIENIGQQIGLDVWFQVKRSLKPKEPNTCDLRLYNLSPAQRLAVQNSTTGSVAAITTKGSAKKASATKASASATVPVTIEAGYVGGTSVLFLGQMRSAQTVTDGPSTVTELTTGDGDEATLLARSTASFGAGATAYTVAQQILSDMGCGSGNIASVASILKGSAMFSSGVVLKGNSLEHLCDLAAGCGLEVSVQNGVAQWQKLGQPLGGEAYVLSTTGLQTNLIAAALGNTGVLGSPTIDTKGILSIETLMLPGLAPGQPIQVNAKYVSGLFRIISIETTGSTFDNDWKHSIQAKPYGLGVGLIVDRQQTLRAGRTVRARYAQGDDLHADAGGRRLLRSELAMRGCPAHGQRRSLRPGHGRGGLRAVERRPRGAREVAQVRWLRDRRLPRAKRPGRP